MRSNSETKIQIALCNYVRMQYPKAIFNVDLSGMNLSKAQAGQAKMMRSSKGFPDFVMYETRGQYKGLFIELKTEEARVFKADGSPADDHIQEQLDMMDQLKSRGYMATLCQGFDEAMQVVDHYMSIN